MKTVKEEILEIWDWETGRPTGRPVGRTLAHREGVPHEGVHLWIVRLAGGRAEVLFQHRSMDKKMYPDCLDITVGGHVPFGLERDKIQKEAEEEVGVVPRDEDLVDLGYFRYEERDGEIFHREFQHVYILVDNRRLDRYSFRDGEVVGIYAVALEDLEELMRGDRPLTAEGYDGKRVFSKRLTRADFHPLLFSPIMGSYMGIVLSAVRSLACGEPVTAAMEIRSASTP